MTAIPTGATDGLTPLNAANVQYKAGNDSRLGDLVFVTKGAYFTGGGAPGPPAGTEAHLAPFYFWRGNNRPLQFDPANIGIPVNFALPFWNEPSAYPVLSDDYNYISWPPDVFGYSSFTDPALNLIATRRGARIDFSAASTFQNQCNTTELSMTLTGFFVTLQNGILSWPAAGFALWAREWVTYSRLTEFTATITQRGRYGLGSMGHFAGENFDRPPTTSMSASGLLCAWGG